MRKAAVIADIIVDAYILDVLTLVQDAVEREMKMAEPDSPEAAYVAYREAAMTKLRKHKAPLSYGALNLLIQVLSTTKDAIRTIVLPSFHGDSLTTKALANSLAVCTDHAKAGARVQAPFITSGLLRRILPSTLQCMTRVHKTWLTTPEGSHSQSHSQSLETTMGQLAVNDTND
jgi:hypothetical protein